MIKIQEVSKIYHGKQGTVEAVKDVSLDIKKGEIFWNYRFFRSR